ncbi:UNVERIFIED_ORG: DNA-binding IclR family transcriptional regulator [Pseudomonas lini]|uniref:HTH-type transcriptional repressor AllR n=1 Tax=Pseudomonas viciae TaxID=2505979 RepID=A0A4P7PIF1_9PSED|nr:IclR family transcriptional regulator [Pseudomonas viciae]QBZ90053.1 IclR family transcriptional regulator [Pseudomonas viciae]UZE84110.1 IclR family transcriptional regulator [Pseudomonas viciae]WGO91022.1 IclR family transcriptional regulator [Pseudomonas viciae]
MNSLRRLLMVFDLFRPEQPVIDVEIICQELGFTPATAYRYLRELGDAGFLKRLPRGYALGPRIVTLEHQMTKYDPLLACSRDLVDKLVDDTGLDALVSEWHGDSVVNVLIQRGSDVGPVGGDRGRPIDLLHSATSRVVLAYLLPRQIRRIYDAHAHPTEPQQQGLAWKPFSKSLLAIRKQGYCMSESELHPGRSGVAAPIFDEKQRVLGSMTLVGRSERFRAFQPGYLCDLVTGAASELTARIALQ